MTIYAVCCKSCGHVERNAWDAEGRPTKEPLTPRGQVPVYCQKCGSRNWQVPALPEQIEKHDAKVAREARAVELCRDLNIDGLLKIPDDVRAAAEVKNALSNLLAPLEGEVLRAAQANVSRIARSGVSVAADMWVELYDRAVQKAVQQAKGARTEKVS